LRMCGVSRPLVLKFEPKELPDRPVTYDLPFPLFRFRSRGWGIAIVRL
jgi:hypothetical protein